MAKLTRYLEFEIHLTDRAQVETLQGQFPNGIRLAPTDAATLYSAPIQEYSAPFSAPCVRSPWFWFNPTSNYPRNLATFTRKSGGWFGIAVLFGTTTTFHWSGKFVLAASPTPEIDGVPTEVVAIAQRRWIDGFELPGGAEQGSGSNATQCYTRDASRHPDGAGFAFRGDSNAVTHLVTTFKPGNTTRSHWDRFYIRVRKAPTAASRIWLSNGGNGNDGVALEVTAGLQLAISNVISGSLTLVTSAGQLTLNTWARVDVVLSYATGAGGAGAYCKIFINGTQIASISSWGATGLGSQGAYLSTAIGSSVANSLEADFDDWIGAEVPSEDTGQRFTGLDWLNGSKVQLIRATSFGTGHDAVNWTNQSYSNLNQTLDAATGMASTTAAAPIVVNTDALTRIDNLNNALGIAALTVMVGHNAVTAGASSLGFKIAGGVLDLSVLANQTGAAYQAYMYRPSGLTALVTPIDPLTLHYLKDNDATSDTVYLLNAVAEVIGVFGDEDVFPGVDAPTTLPPRALGPHNNPYPESPWARLITAPAAPYIIHSGTYTGNGLGQDLYFRCPVHWIWVRCTSVANSDPSFWFASLMAPHSASAAYEIHPDVPVQAFIDPAFTGGGAEDDQEQRTIVRITGADALVNQAAATYQYVAVSDPLGRFLLTGGFFHGAVNATNADLLARSLFTPESGFFQFEDISGAAVTTGGYFKGLGHAANAISLLNATETADFLSWSQGAISPRDASTLGAALTAGFALWRRDDGSGDPGIPKVVQLGTYIGDGTASRTVSYGPAGVRPLWLVVVPHNAAAIFRDPAHTGTTSCTLNGTANASTGITGGAIDSFSVGSALNANGIVYSWLLLPGGTTAGNNGWSADGEFIPVEPDWPDDGPWPTDEPADPDAPVTGEPDPTEPTAPPDDTEDCAAGAVCVTETTRVINRSLLEIGVSQFLTNFCTQQTKEAQIARLLYDASVRAVLHAFPWPFATKYAVLALAGTQPSNADWTFSYRAPVDCIFPRRIVVARGTADNPEPPPFQMSSDAGGQLIFTNEPNAVLEYTFRPACVAFMGDDLFREALRWHLAAALAPPLTRMNGEAERCTKHYVECIEQANAIIKPGVPGARPAAPTIDVAQGCITANIQVVNMGLMRIGAQTIANLTTEQSREAIAAKLVFESELRAVLRDYSWKFAKRYNDTLVLVGGSATVRVSPDWQYSYRLPTDCVKVRRLATDGKYRKFDRDPKTWEVGTDATGGLLFTNEIDPQMEYTARIECAVSLGDDLFRDAFAWRLAAAMAPSVAQVDPHEPEQRGRGPEAPPDPRQRVSHKPSQAIMRHQVAQRAWAMYQVTLSQARVGDANESQPEKPGEAEWIDGRN